MLSIHSFRKAFGDQTILAIPELSMDHGIHWIKGRNGSGKTTLFNCIAGLSPYHGQIALSGISLERNPGDYKLKVNYSQSEPVYPEFLSGEELIAYFAKLKKAETDQVNSLVQSLGLDQFAHKPAGSYSSGMIKKLSIVLAFLGEPSLIILDEPLITLDKEAQQVVTQLIATRYQQGVAFIFATHQDFENALITATQVYEVRESQIHHL